MTPSKFFRKSRKAAGLSQGDLSRELGYSSPQFVSNWERNLCHPPIPAMKQMIKMGLCKRNDLVKVMVKDYRDKLRKGL